MLLVLAFLVSFMKSIIVKISNCYVRQRIPESNMQCCLYFSWRNTWKRRKYFCYNCFLLCKMITLLLLRFVILITRTMVSTVLVVCSRWSDNAAVKRDTEDAKVFLIVQNLPSYLPALVCAFLLTADHVKMF